MQRALEGLAGVQKVELRFDDQELTVHYDARRCTTDAMIAAIKKAKNFDATVKK